MLRFQIKFNFLSSTSDARCLVKFYKPFNRETQTGGKNKSKGSFYLAIEQSDENISQNYSLRKNLSKLLNSILFTPPPQKKQTNKQTNNNNNDDDDDDDNDKSIQSLSAHKSASFTISP